jgi:hypothetical protein
MELQSFKIAGAVPSGKTLGHNRLTPSMSGLITVRLKTERETLDYISFNINTVALNGSERYYGKIISVRRITRKGISLVKRLEHPVEFELNIFPEERFRKESRNGIIILIKYVVRAGLVVFEKWNNPLDRASDLELKQLEEKEKAA